MKRLTAALLSLCLSLVLGACDDFEEALTCIDDDRPQFSRYALPDATRGQPYDVSIVASLNNTTNDDDFTYTFTESGERPEGIDFTVSNRTVTFAGTPQRSGTFLITLQVRISDGDAAFYGNNGDADTLCKTERTHTYSLVVE